MWAHCMMHNGSLAMKELCPELSEMLDTVLKTVNCMKTGPLESRLLHNYARKLGAKYQSLLFYCNSHWLSRGKVVSCLQLARRSTAVFRREKSSIC
jgi:hypothetical protein